MTCPVGKVEDTKGVIRCPKIKERQTIQCPPQKRTNNDLQSTTQKTKDQATRTPLKTRDKHRCPGIGKNTLYSSSANTCLSEAFLVSNRPHFMYLPSLKTSWPIELRLHDTRYEHFIFQSWSDKGHII
jgi:hypothetical protein